MTIDTEIHRAIGFLEGGKSAKALTCLRTLEPESETNTLRCNLVGLIYLSAKQNPSALKWYDHALALDPTNSEALSNRGLALQELGRAADALAVYDEAVRAGCVKPALFYNRGNLLRDAGRLTEAIASYDRALRLDPAYPEALR
ncbi:MAG: tetratricopeptide repeat protein, partial [Methylocella sp.]